MSSQLKSREIRRHLGARLLELFDNVRDLLKAVGVGIWLRGARNSRDDEEGSPLEENNFFGFGNLCEASEVIFELWEVWY